MKCLVFYSLKHNKTLMRKEERIQPAAKDDMSKIHKTNYHQIYWRSDESSLQ